MRGTCLLQDGTLQASKFSGSWQLAVSVRRELVAGITSNLGGAAKVGCGGLQHSERIPLALQTEVGRKHLILIRLDVKACHS